MYIISDSGITALIRAIESCSSKYFWIRSPDYKQQIYISDRFSNIWAHNTSDLFEHPELLVESLVKDENDIIKKQYHERANSNNKNEKNILARIHGPENTIQHLRDSCFKLCDSYGNVIGVAGIGEIITADEWHKDLENEIEHSDPLQQINKSRESKHIG